MANKTNQSEMNDKSATETWRKPLQVPPRRNAMRSFYRGEEDEAEESDNRAIAEENRGEANPEEIELDRKTKTKTALQSPPKKQGREAVKAKPQNERTITSERKKDIFESIATTAGTTPPAAAANELTKEELSEKLGIEIDDLFDIHELLRGKSFDIYQTLLQSSDDNGRCKITQPELMKRTAIKNRRTFYKHEEWLIRLKLLEKRHLPGDHKGVVYRILKIQDVLPLSNELLSKFKRELEKTE